MLTSSSNQRPRSISLHRLLQKGGASVSSNRNRRPQVLQVWDGGLLLGVIVATYLFFAKYTKDCEWVCKPGSVPGGAKRREARSTSGRRSFICARRLLVASLAIYPNGIAGRTALRGCPTSPGRGTDHSVLFDLASDGVYQADRVTPIAGALLPHRFSLATHSGKPHVVCQNRSAVYSLLHFP